MEDKLNNDDGRNRTPLYLAMVVAMLGAGVANAADIVPAPDGPNGLIAFPHVRVVNRPDLAAAPSKAVARQGFKAYIDPATGMLRDPTQEELQQESIAGLVAEWLAQLQSNVDVQFVTPSGAIGLNLPESSMMFSVVQKGDDGSLNEFCVVGPEAAEKLKRFKAPASSALNRKGVSDVR
jgi:hypothetical protein